MSDVWSPANALALQEAVADALADGKTFELVGAGTRRCLGRPVSADVQLDLSGLGGVTLYQPEELVLVAAPSTPLAAVEHALAARGQWLAFEPPDFGPLWGLAAGSGTLGGAMIAGIGGPRRLTAGAPRDYCLGVKGVNGFAQAFASGGRVVKNVTGFDLSKLICGSFGTLCAVSELALKVAPAAHTSASLAVFGLDDQDGVALMARALALPAPVTSAAHLPSAISGRSRAPLVSGHDAAVTLLRLEGVREAVAAGLAHVERALGAGAGSARLALEESQIVWREIAGAAYFEGSQAPVWKISAPPSRGAAIGAELTSLIGGRCFYDWGGGAIWFECAAAPDAHAGKVRSILARLVGADGHATLMRASPRVREETGPFQPLAPELAALNRRVRAQFDPKGIFNPGRMEALV